MNLVSYSSFHTSISSIWWKIYEGATSLFTHALPLPQPLPTSDSPLLHKIIKIGGVQNAGNTCVLSVVLQEFAAFPDYYDIFLNASLVQDHNESEFDFSKRQQTQKLLNELVHKIRSGITVNTEEIDPLCEALIHFGWEASKCLKGGYTESNPCKLYDLILSLFSEATTETHQIALLARPLTVNLQEFIQSTSILSDSQDHILWRILEEDESNSESSIFPDYFELQQRKFYLQMLYVAQKTSKISHVKVYRKVHDHWYCCNDGRVSKVNKPISKDIYMAVYDSSRVRFRGVS